MGDEAGLRYCPRCGDEYHAWVEQCIDCGVALADEPPMSVAEPVDGTGMTDGALTTGAAGAAAEQRARDHAVTALSLDGTTVDERDLLTALLRGRDIPFQLAGSEIQVPRSRQDEAMEVIDWAHDGPYEPDESAGVEQPATPSPVSRLRPFRRLSPDGSLVIASRWRRLAGWHVDGLVLWFMWLGLAAIDLPVLHIPVVAVYVIGATWVWGQTVGKFAAGTRVVDITAIDVAAMDVATADVATTDDSTTDTSTSSSSDGSTRDGSTSDVADPDTAIIAAATNTAPPPLVAATLRWLPTGVATVLAWIPSSPVITFIAFVVTYAPVLWDPYGQGLHDRLARTMVVNDPASVR